jgi:exodeoxyribonuclease VII large subunit
VQGEGAAAQIAAAIAGFNRLEVGGAVPRPDLLIVARGGGSLEDLMAFNEEIVVRAAAASTIPLISAVGHETDWTLIDHAADRRAPTPSAAAEMAVPVRAELMANTAECGQRLFGAMTRWLTWRREQLQGLARGLPDPRRLLQELTQRLDDWMERLAATRVDLIARRRERLVTLAGSLRTPDQLIAMKGQALGHAFERLQAGLERDLTARRHRFDRAAVGLRPGLVHDRLARGRDALAAAAQLLDSLSYENVLQRGFVLAMDKGGKPVTMAARVDPGSLLTLQFRDGKVRTRAEGPVTDGVSAAKPPAKPAKRSGGDGPQGSLL